MFWKMNLKQYGLKLKIKKVKMYSAAVLIDTQMQKSINLINILIELWQKYQKKINWYSAWVILM